MGWMDPTFELGDALHDALNEAEDGQHTQVFHDTFDALLAPLNMTQLLNHVRSKRVVSVDANHRAILASLEQGPEPSRALIVDILKEVFLAQYIERWPQLGHSRPQQEQD